MRSGQFVLPADGRRPEIPVLAWLAVVYLSLPVVVFALSWLQWWLALPAALAVMFMIAALRPVAGDRASLLRTLAISLPLAGLAAVFSGFSPLFDTIPLLDLEKHRWLYHDLVTQPWPVTYPESDAVLRYSMAFYLVPAALAKVAGPGAADGLMLLWLAIGVGLFLANAVADVERPLPAAAAAVALLLAGGLDLPASLIVEGWKLPLDHPDGWSRHTNTCKWLIGSNPFALSWTPQHAVSAWLGAVLLLRHHRSPWFHALAALICSCLLLWSPFVALAFAFIALPVVLWRSHWTPWRAGFTLLGTLLAVPLLVYLLSGAAGVRSGWNFACLPPGSWLVQYLAFCAVEWGILLGALVLAGEKRLEVPLLLSIVLLLFLPATYVGKASDLMARGAQLPVTILFLAALRTLTTRGWRGGGGALGAVMLVGVLGGAVELSLLLGARRTPVDPAKSIQALDEVFLPQYLAPAKGGVSSVLRLDDPSGAAGIPLGPVSGAHGKEGDGWHWWRWVEHRVTVSFLPGSVPGQTVRISFAALGRGAQSLAVVVTATGDRRHTALVQLADNELREFQIEVPLPGGDVRELAIESDARATPLGAADGRLAAFQVRDLRVTAERGIAQPDRPTE